MRAQIGMVALAFGALLFYSGAGVVRLLAFPRIRPAELLLAPLAGAALLITVGSWVGVLGGSAAWGLAIALTAATVVNLGALTRARALALDVRTSLGAFILTALVVAVAVAPLWARDRGGTVIGGNGDQVFYTNIASYLERAGLPVPAPGPLQPAALQRSFLDIYGVPLGFPAVHAMVDRLTGWPAYATFSVVTAVLLALNVLAAVFLATCLFGLGRRWALAVGAVSAASPALMWIHYNNYAMHALGIGLAPAALGLAILALEEGGRRGLILAALLLSALSVSYPPAAGPFALAPLAAWVLLRAWRGSRRRVLLGRVAALGLLAAAMNLAGFVHVAKVLRPMLGFVLVREFGDVSSHVSPAHLLGLVHHALPLPPAWVSPLVAALTTGAALLVAHGLAGSSSEGRRAFMAMLVTAVPFVLWLRLGLDYPYGFYKGLTFLAWPVTLGMVLGVRRALAGPAIVRVLAVALLLILAGASAINLLRVARAVTVFDLEPMRELRALRGLAPGDEILHVRDESGTALLWVTYFLDDRPLVLGRDSPYYLHRRWPFYQEAITAPLVLVNRDAARPSPWAAATVHENDRYRVLRKDPAVLSYLDFDGAPRALAADQQFRLDFLADRTLIDGRSFPVAFPVGEGRTVAMGVWAVGGATLRVQDAHGARVLRVSGGEPLRWPASPRPAQATIANVGGETILLAGWAAVTERGPWPAGGEVTGGPLDVLRDEVVPGSGFFAVGGWHGPEGGVRWSRGSGVAVFANPGRAAPLRMDCLLWRPGLVEATRLALLVNGRPAGTPACSGAPEVFALSEALLGPLSWAMLEIRVDPVFVPQRAGVSTDPRELGVLVRSLRLEPAMGQGPGRGHP